MTRYAFPNLSKKQREILDELGCGNYTLSGVFPTKQAIADLIDRELIRYIGEKLICRDRFGAVKVPEYEMTLPTHAQWCSWQASQPCDEEA